MRIKLTCPDCGVRVPYAGRCDDCDVPERNEVERADSLALAQRAADAELGDL